MALFKSGNPTLSEKNFEQSVSPSSIAGENAMTVRGTLNKFGFLFLMVMASAFYTWQEFTNRGDVMPYMWTGVIGGFIVALIIMFKKQWAPYLAPLYALLEGLFIGAVSAAFQYAFQETAPGIVVNSILLTFGVAIAMYVLFVTRVIRVTETFRAVIIVATVGLMIFYLIAMVLRMTGVTDLQFIYQGGSPLAIGFSLFVVGLAALNLVMDFDMIEKGAQMGAPKYMEWYGAFGLMVTIIWLYLEILRLLSKFASRK